MLADALLWDKVSGDILAVGTNAAAAAAAWRKAGAHVEALDLQGRFLMPVSRPTLTTTTTTTTTTSCSTTNFLNPKT